MQIGKKKLDIFLLIAPAVIIYLVFCIIPLVSSISYSFYDWNGVNEKIFIGLGNYKELLGDGEFYNSLKNNSIIILFAVMIQIPLAYFLAEMLSRKLKGTSIFEGIYFLPAVISTVIIALMWYFILNPNEGFINVFLTRVGLENFKKGWIGDNKMAIYCVAFVNVWQFVGVSMVILLAGIRAVPQDIHDSCLVDGVSGIRKSLTVTIPLIKEALITTTVLSVTGSLKMFDLVFSLTNGGPGSSSQVLATYMYKQAFFGYRYGYGVTIAVAIFIFSAIFSLIFMRITQNKD
ncbi:MAG: sugar transporter permease [Clostridia bacterium]|jgi:raffinose/stachyose/melibiose transport system permease protein|nr:sugar transporter permease [Clostridia bacterium]